MTPELLVLDEATAGLDPVVRGELLDLFLEFIQDERHSIVMSSHITADLEQIADSIAYLHNGQLLFQENKDDLFAGIRRAALRRGCTDFPARRVGGVHQARGLWV